MNSKTIFKIATIVFVLGMIAFTIHFMMNTTSPSERRKQRELKQSEELPR